MDVIMKGGAQSSSLTQDSNKTMGHDPAKHMSRVHGAPKSDHTKTTTGKGDALAYANKTTTPMAKSYKPPK